MTLLFVAGAHTDVGKTHAACALLVAARTAGRRVAAFKPVISGFDAAQPEASDAGRLLEALGRPLDAAAMDAISPLRFSAPVAPPLAARRHGVRLTCENLVRACASWIENVQCDVGLIEGAGGIMSPIAEDATNLDLIGELGLPVLLVGGAYLGSISHTLSALEVLRGRDVSIAALVISQAADSDAPDFLETIELTRQFAGPVAVYAAGRNSSRAWAEELSARVSGHALPGVPSERRRANDHLNAQASPDGGSLGRA